MQYSKYRESRDLAWQILLDNKIDRLPVRVSGICRFMGYAVTSYARGREAIERFGLSEAAENNDGFTYKSVIFYNDVCTVERQRFTVAHELGHILLHNGNGLYNREPQVKDNPIEQEANVFASRLLAPACVLWGLGVTNAGQIAELCNISIQSAKFRMERLNKLYEREKEFRQKYGRSCFLLSPAERAVYEQFREYISEHRL